MHEAERDKSFLCHLLLLIVKVTDVKFDSNGRGGDSWAILQSMWKIYFLWYTKGVVNKNVAFESLHVYKSYRSSNSFLHKRKKKTLKVTLIVGNITSKYNFFNGRCLKEASQVGLRPQAGRWDQYWSCTTV